jgi:hypothetical protein
MVFFWGKKVYKNSIKMEWGQSKGSSDMMQIESGKIGPRVKVVYNWQMSQS